MKLTLILAAIFSPVVPLLMYFWGNVFSLDDILHDFSLAMVFGIMAFMYFQVVLLISARIRFLIECLVMIE